MHRVGALLMAIGLAIGLALSAFLYQWDSTQRALEASPTPASESSGALAASPRASPAAGVVEKGGTGDGQGGKTLFNSLCNACHPNGKAGVGPVLLGLSEETMRAGIRKGEGSMPAFGEAQISESQMAELLAYVKSLK